MTCFDYFESRFQHISKCVYKTSEVQLRHRMTLVQMWAPKPGDHVLDVGCGHGETTVALAEAVGDHGQILAVDTAGPHDGGATTIHEAHACINSSELGSRIQFRLSTDLLAPDIDFPAQSFDLVVFSHSSWYMSSPRVLERLFARIRPWAKRLGFAEWDLRPQNMSQLPHMLAALLQTHILSVWPESPPVDVCSLILPQQARLIAERAGWKIAWERNINTSTQLEDGMTWRIFYALFMAEQLLESRDGSVSESTLAAISSEVQLLSEVADDEQVRVFQERRETVDGENRSLSTYVFLAE